MEYVRYRLNPLLAEALARLHSTRHGEALERAVGHLAGVGDESPTGPALRSALAPQLWVLEQAEAGALALTEAGYLRPRDVRALADLLPTMPGWVHSISSESRTMPVAAFRQDLHALGLVRRYKGSLRVSRRARVLLADPEALWEHLQYETLPEEPSYVAIASLLILLQACLPDGEPQLHDVADAMTHLGFAHPDGAPVAAPDVWPVWNMLWARLGNVGPAQASRPSGRRLSPAAVSLIKGVAMVVA